MKCSNCGYDARCCGLCLRCHYVKAGDRSENITDPSLRNMALDTLDAVTCAFEDRFPHP